MVHVKEKEEQVQFFSDGFDATFEEAVEFMKEKLSLTPEEFYSLDAKARFRAFTVAKLTGLDAIERVKEKLPKAIEEGKTLKEWIEELGEDGILQAVGFHQSNPWYLETVFRTNVSTAYNAGRLMQFARSKDRIKLLEYVAIDDNRTTPICRRLDGTKLPPDDPFWATYTPPNHFNCRSTVRAIFKGSTEAKKARVRKPKNIPPVPEGFAGSPFNSWWKLTDSMAKRIVKYGLRDEVLKKAKELCRKNFTDECPEWEEVKRLIEKYNKRREILKKLIGEKRTPKAKLIDGRIAEVKKGQVIELFVHERTQKWVRSKVAEVFEDELGNKYYLTDYHLRHITQGKRWKKFIQAGIDSKAKLLSWMRKIIREPQVIVYDVRENAVYFGREKDNRVVILSLAGIDTLRIMTAFPKEHIFENRQRLRVLFSEIERWK